jgi:hypothetical protein
MNRIWVTQTKTQAFSHANVLAKHIAAHIAAIFFA